MSILFLEVGNLDGLFLLIFLIMFGPALLFFVIALILNVKNKKKAAKVFFILTGVYFLVSLGTCGALLGGY